MRYDLRITRPAEYADEGIERVRVTCRENGVTLGYLDGYILSTDHGDALDLVGDIINDDTALMASQAYEWYGDEIDTIGCMTWLFVEEAHRTKGIGIRLVKKFVRAMEKRDVQATLGIVSSKNTKRLIRYYQWLGFELRNPENRVIVMDHDWLLEVDCDHVSPMSASAGP